MKTQINYLVVAKRGRIAYSSDTLEGLKRWMEIPRQNPPTVSLVKQTITYEEIEL